MFLLKGPLRAIIVGPSGSGKSHLLTNIIKNKHRLIDTEINKVIYCAKYPSSYIDELKNLDVIFHQGLPTSEMLTNDQNEHILICLDDLPEAFSSEEVNDLYLAGRHRRISVITISHNLFGQYKKSRNISLNCNYIFIFGSRRDYNQINVFARQTFPNCAKELMELYLKETASPYSWLLFDFNSTSRHVMRIRNNIFSSTPNLFCNEDQVQADKEAKKIESLKEVQGYMASIS
jgi:hypothetical protein